MTKTFNVKLDHYSIESKDFKVIVLKLFKKYEQDILLTFLTSSLGILYSLSDSV